MGINVTDLPLNMQKQALRKLAEEEKRKEKKREIEWDDSPVIEDTAQKNNKYHAQKTTLQLPDGTEHTFDSKHEAKVYHELAFRQMAGEISDLRIQVKYVLIPSQVAPSGKKYRECSYKADFVYKDNETGKTVVADAKGHRTKDYILKKKLMLQVWGIEILEV